MTVSWVQGRVQVTSSDMLEKHFTQWMSGGDGLTGNVVINRHHKSKIKYKWLVNILRVTISPGPREHSPIFRLTSAIPKSDAIATFGLHSRDYGQLQNNFRYKGCEKNEGLFILKNRQWQQQHWTIFSSDSLIIPTGTFITRIWEWDGSLILCFLRIPPRDTWSKNSQNNSQPNVKWHT